MSKITESESNYDKIEEMSIDEILTSINKEDSQVTNCVFNSIPNITLLIDSILKKMIKGGRLFYIGSGTSGRLGIVDASECPPTFGVSHDKIIGIIAGGDEAIRKSIEFAEDNFDLGWQDLSRHNVSIKDFVLGIAASGTTPYVIGALKQCKKNNISTGSLVCNTNTPLSLISDFPVEVIVGPEFITGSTRMKSGTAQKLVLNLICTALMSKLGRVQGNKMIDMQLSNEKLVKRGTKIIVKECNVKYLDAYEILLKTGSVRKSIDYFNSNG